MNLFRGKSEARKLHKIGDYSYCLVLPKDWVAQHGNPSEVEVKAKRGRIIIMPMKTKRLVR